MSVLRALSDFESTGALKKGRSSLLIQFLVACYVVCITYADLPKKPLIAHIVSPPTKLSLLAPDLSLPADFPVFSRPYYKGLYTNPVPNLVVETAQPPYYGPLIPYDHTPSINPRMSRRSMNEKAVVPHSAGLAPPDIAAISPTQSGDDCCGSDMVLKRGTRGCHCVYPVKIDMLLINVSSNPNWNLFLKDFAYQLGLRDSQINPVNFYVVTLSNWNISLDITPYKGISFSASEASGINSSLSSHRVHLNPNLVGDYKLLNITWFKSLAPSQAPRAAKPPVEVPPHKRPSPAAPVTSQKGTRPSLILLVAIGAGILIIGIIMLLIVCLCISHKGKKEESPVKTETAKTITSNAPPSAGPVPHPTSTRFLAYEELKEATNNFDSSSILGEGGFGKVFKGILSDGTQVAIKRLTSGGQQGGKEFLVEVEMLSRLHHRNLVKLVGYYSNRDSSQNLLCYELVPNGSLEQWLHGPLGLNCPLDWDTRMKIALDAARGLAYLHEDSQPCVIHRDFKIDVHPIEQDDVSQVLLERFKCAATFLPPNLLEKFYDIFCKRQLWPLFHYMLPFSADHGSRFDRSMWEAYVSANKLFSQKVIEVINPEDDFVWIHDYHLMVLPTFLRRRFNRLRMGFFLHSPFPSSEIYRTLPVREEILKALLNSDLIGFHTFDYARHFLSCCSRMLGLEYQSKRGYIGLEYFGRTVGIKIMPVGIHMGQIESVMRLADKEWRVGELKQRFEGKSVLLGVDDMDVFKGINLKLLAMEQMLKQHPDWQGRAVLVQIVNPARGKGIDLEQTRAEILESCKRINAKFGKPGYEPIVFIDKPLSMSEKISYFSIAECVVVTAVRDGMNLTPYEYIVCRQGISGAEASSDLNGPKKSMLVVSEFIGCSPSLSGAIRVNPWNVEATAEAMNEAISMDEGEKQLRHEKHYRYVSSHDVAYWSRSFLQDMERTCADHFKKRCWGIGLGFGFRVVSLDPNFRKLSIDDIVSSYIKSKRRAILLDYDGTVMPQNSLIKSPSSEVFSILNRLCGDPNNTVFIVSGRGRDSLSRIFSSCKKLGIAAEHGYFMRQSIDEDWEVCGQSTEFGWMEMAKPVMKLYTEATDGSSIETKESALVWQYRDADPGFGFSQAKEMLDHLESVLANEPVAVRSGQFIVEVKPQGVSKGLVAEKIFTSMAEKGKQADFVLCIGDDRSDEDMFEIIGSAISANILSSNTSVFACTVGQKPSKAKYYLDDSSEVILMLENLAEATDSPASSDAENDISP